MGCAGPHLLLHLGGGADGIEHLFDQFTVPMTAWWKVLVSPEVALKMRKKIIAGVLEETSKRSLEDLAAQRDEELPALLAVQVRVQIEPVQTPGERDARILPWSFHGEEPMPKLPTDLIIRDIQVRAVLAPLKTPMVTALGSSSKAPLVLIDLHTEQGITGRAYLVAKSPVALKALETLVRDLGNTLVGQKVAPVERHAELRALFALIGGTRGLAGIAISGLDLALWDALAIAAQLPLATMLGGRPEPLRAYNSLGMIRASVAAQEAIESVEAGFTAVKFKVGWPMFADDLAAVRAFREAAPSLELMLDFNQSLTLAEALRRGHALESEGLTWIEEPIRCDDFVSCARIAAELKTPIQIGENLSGIFDLKQALLVDASDYLMLDVQQIGGVTGWLRAMALAQAAGKELSSHSFPQVSAHLLTVTPTRHWLEFLDFAGAVLAEPLKVVQGTVTASDRPGVGLEWDEAAVAKTRV